MHDKIIDNSIKFWLSVFSLFFLFCFGSITYAEDTNNVNKAHSTSFDYWHQIFPISQDYLKTIGINNSYSNTKEILPFVDSGVVYGLSVSGTAQLNSDKSLVRLTLVDKDFHEYLIYEAYPLLTNGSKSFGLLNVCEETCLLESITPVSIIIELIDASLYIDSYSFSNAAKVSKSILLESKKLIRNSQNAWKIEQLNKNIHKKGLKWIADETSISQLTYEEKKKMFGENKVPNLQGAEYYKGGIFEIKSNKTLSPVTDAVGSSSLIETFDWRNRHSAIYPESPYYDGDPIGSGWITPVKSQGCNHCWAFASLHATEALTNLFFNQHLDLDLSEQDVGSCSGGDMGCCDGGIPSWGLEYIINTGVVDEQCFPYSSSCESCSNKCSSPTEHIKISGYLIPAYEDEQLKRAIIDYGPIMAGIYSWWHEMVMVGFDKDHEDGQTIWIFKNSYGLDWGENGYGYVKVDLSDLYNVFALLTPIKSLITPYEVVCLDQDGDGYYNWGLSNEKPSTCPIQSALEKDCDDSNPNIGLMNSNGQCIPIGNAYALNITKTGSGGVVKSTPYGIHCGTDCADYYKSGTNITLTAESDMGYVLGSWSGCKSTSGNTCYVTMDSNKNVTAHYIKGYTLTVYPQSGGRLTGPGINCPGDCSEAYMTGANIALTAVPDSGYDIASWYCDGLSCDSESDNTCYITMNADRCIRPQFDKYYKLNVNLNPPNGGQITGIKINCPADCSADYFGWESESLSAIPNSGYKLNGWSGCNMATESMCNVTMEADKTVTANYTRSYSPGYRFWSNTFMHHFYTISEYEKDYVIATWPDKWTYEGPVFYAYPSQVTGTLPVYRFWSNTFLGHFYTISETEKDYVIATWPQTWTYEGPVFYAYPNP
jgi:C1A family cysteine protease